MQGGAPVGLCRIRWARREPFGTRNDESGTLPDFLVDPADVFTKDSYAHKLDATQKLHDDNDRRIPERETDAGDFQRRIENSKQERA